MKSSGPTTVPIASCVIMMHDINASRPSINKMAAIPMIMTRVPEPELCALPTLWTDCSVAIVALAIPLWRMLGNNWFPCDLQEGVTDGFILKLARIKDIVV